MPPLPLERDPRQQRGVSLLVRYFMIPCNVCLILLATATLGFAVLLFLNNCTWLRAWPPWAQPRGPCLCWLSWPASAAKDWGTGRVTERPPAGMQLRWATCIFWGQDGPFCGFLGPWKPLLGLIGG